MPHQDRWISFRVPHFVSLSPFFVLLDRKRIGMWRKCWERLAHDEQVIICLALVLAIVCNDETSS